MKEKNHSITCITLHSYNYTYLPSKDSWIGDKERSGTDVTSSELKSKMKI
jgi:hypothetical protein